MTLPQLPRTARNEKMYKILTGSRADSRIKREFAEAHVLAARTHTLCHAASDIAEAARNASVARRSFKRAEPGAIKQIVPRKARGVSRVPTFRSRDRPASNSARPVRKRIIPCA